MLWAGKTKEVEPAKTEVAVGLDPTTMFPAEANGRGNFSALFSKFSQEQLESNELLTRARYDSSPRALDAGHAGRESSLQWTWGSCFVLPLRNWLLMPASHSKRFGASHCWKCNRNEQRTTALDIYQDWSLEYTYQCVCMCVHTHTNTKDVKSTWREATSYQSSMCNVLRICIHDIAFSYT